MSAATIAAVEARLAARDAAGALAAAGTALAEPGLAISERIALLKLRARAHEALRDYRAAIVDLEGVLALAPGDARAANDLGLACADAGDMDGALAAFLRATRIDPGYAHAWNNYANAQRLAGRADAAAESFARAVAADPAYALGWANLGAVRREIGDAGGAESALVRALALNPAQKVAVFALAGLRREQNRLDEAAKLYAQASDLDGRDANPALLLGATLAERDDLEHATQAFTTALQRDPALLRAALAQRLTLPMVPESMAAIRAARERYADGLARLVVELPERARALSPDRAVDELRWCNFLLAYQGEDDRALQARYAGVVRSVLAVRAPEWLAPSARQPKGGTRVRVGFASAFFRDGTAGRYFERWVTGLPRERFEVAVYHLQPTLDPLAARLRERADLFRHCPRWRPAQLAPRIRSDTLDVLVYPELGMDATTFGLASLRLAPRQCAAWGHPVTTGLPTIDTFFTCASMEPGDAAEQYSEALERLPGIGTHYARPRVPPAADRGRYGLPDAAALLLCPQSLFKIHPDDDALFARVLAAAPAAHLVLFEGRHPALTAKMRARILVACEAAGIDGRTRLHFVPQCAHEDYLALIQCCAVMLDTLRWSGGNTTLDALACGLPVVTLPGRFMRARQSAAMLAMSGVDDLVARDADDYVRVAAELAGDRAHRDAMSVRIRDGCRAIFDDPAPVAALADALTALA